MTILDLSGYFAAIFVGMTLGIIGAGGSILTVPVLVYLFGITPTLATAYSLFVVGLTALVGSTTYMRQKLVSHKTALIFAIPSFVTVFMTRKFIMPAIPTELFVLYDKVITKDLAIMVLFALLMLTASFSMIRGGGSHPEERVHKFDYMLILVEGFGVGLLTGLVGMGGGFLIIPALVVFAKLPMKMAVGTSLLIIAANALVGFTGDLGTTPIDWFFLVKFSTFTVAGIVVGSYLGRFFSSARLKPMFGWFVLVMGIYIIVREVLGVAV